MASILNPSTPPGYCDRNAAANAIVVLGAITLFLATVLVCLRMYTRIIIVKAFWWDDLFLIIAYLMIIPTLALAWRNIHLGLGRHVGCYPGDNIFLAAKYELIAQTLDLTSTILSRTSVALFVGRLFINTSNQRIALAFFTVFMALALSVTTGVAWAWCTPVHAVWNPTITPKKCWPMPALHFVMYFNGVVSVLSDFVLAVLPVIYVRTLNTSQGKKVILYFLLGLGFLPGACAIVRTVFTGSLMSTDPLYDTPMLGLFGILELTLLAICASIPALPPLFKNKQRQSVTNNNNNNNPIWWIESKPPNKRQTMISEISEASIFEAGKLIRRIEIPSGIIRWSIRSDQPDDIQPLGDVEEEP